ncbi:MAG: PDZ domain-containing protein [Nevskia sp.]|nr:PDZ domain-containing protein [Nevskia sp.]
MARARKAAVRYAVALDPLAHLFRVRCELAEAAAGQVFWLPSWIRGSYLVRDFSKHVQRLRASVGGVPATIERIDKRSFRVVARGALTLEYEVHAYDNSVRKAYLDARRGFFNGSSLFYCPAGYEQAAFEISIAAPDPEQFPGWKLATAMTEVAVDEQGFGAYLAADYEELIDHPVEMSDFRKIDFDVDGVSHSLVLSGRCEPDEARLAADLRRLCHVQRELFGQEPALHRYLFLTQVTGNGYGGLEHRASTALVCARDALPRPGQSGLRKGYRGFLGLVSHEYFHLWNVKRITPRAFAESRLAAEAYSQDLWAYEGVTSYYDDYLLLRSGLLDPPAYLDLLAETATRLQRIPGRFLQTLAESSFDAWIKYYQPDEHTPNATVNYYVKGALASLCLDLTLRLKSAITLDDVVRALWTRYGRSGQPVPEGGLEQIAIELAGLDLRPLFDSMLRSTDELPLAELLAEFGVKTALRPATGPGDEGGRGDAKTAAAWTGLQLRAADTAIAHVLSGSPAERAGLAAGDQLVAFDGLKLTSANWAKHLEGLTAGREIAVHYFRGDELQQSRLTPQQPPADTWVLTLADAEGARLDRRRKWLGA